MMRFHPLDAEDVDRAIAAERSDLSADERTAMVRIAEGAPGRALRYAGLDIAGLTASIERIEGRGRQAFGAQATLAKSLALKAGQPRYEAFLVLAPAQTRTENARVGEEGDGT